MRQRQEKAHGPYQRGSKWRVVEVAATGARSTISFESEAEAIEYISGFTAEATGRTVSVAIDEFIAHLKADGRAPGTIATAGYRLHGLLRDGERNRLLSEVTPAVAAKLYRQRVADGVKPDTHRGELAIASQMAAWCVEQGWITRDPFADVKPVGRKRAGRGKSQIRVDESRTLLDFILALCSPTVKPEPVAVLVALLLGSRAHEVVERDVRDLDDDGQLLWIPDSKTDSGRRTLEIPEVLQPLLRALAKGRRGTEPLFIATDGPGARRKRGTRRATRHWLHYHCRLLCAAAGVPVITPQALRRTHSSIARRGGATGELVAEQLGQGSVAVQRRSYVAPGAAEAGEARQVMRVLQGGRR
jgi:integrase